MESKLPYNLADLERELAPYYIGATPRDIEEMLAVVGEKDLASLFRHIPEDIRFSCRGREEGMDYSDLVLHMERLSQKNSVGSSFVGHALKHYRQPELSAFVCGIRGLTTAYTPYQPERSQGTLWSLWMYSSCLSMLTGFEAINASLYDRASCLFEASRTALRLVRGSDTILLSDGIYGGDREVLETHARQTGLHIVRVPLGDKGGTDIGVLSELVEAYGGRVAGLIFMQVNALGILEDIHALTIFCRDRGFQSIAVVDPLHLATGGLIPPGEFGGMGADMIVGEGQHLGLSPNFGGPGLGIFGIRFNKDQKNAIRSTAGRYVGKSRDGEGNEALCMVLSTREQHIRREKATSNICSNQSFLATLAGAGILARGEKGMREACTRGARLAAEMAPLLTAYREVRLAFPDSPIFNEICLELDSPVGEVLQKARTAGIGLGVDVSDFRRLLLISFTDIHTSEDIEKLKEFFARTFTSAPETAQTPVEIPSNYRRQGEVGLPQFKEQELRQFYTKLGEQNISPDDNIYPLGSCTMKYNPWINDWAASLPGFANVHPEVCPNDAQGCLEVLYTIQERFKVITGLPGVTTEPVAGAQGELVGLKMFQAYHRDLNKGGSRDVILIPASAHGTNPATAAVAGIDKIVTVEADGKGQIDFDQLTRIVGEYGERIIGIMVTNPNTSGIFETRFKDMAALIHSVGGLVYMDGANMNAIAGWVDLGKMGVDAVHNNLHKTWTIPHGGGGPGDAIVAVSEKLLDYLPGVQIVCEQGRYRYERPVKSIGSFHRHFGNFAHKVRCYTYLAALGDRGVRQMSAVAVLSSRYLYERLKAFFPTLPAGAEDIPRMHEFILTLTQEMFERVKQTGVPRAQVIPRVGKLFLDFGLHAPTVAFPEVYGLMVEPTESFSKTELDEFVGVCEGIARVVNKNPELLKSTPHFTPVRRVDEVHANKNLLLSEKIECLPTIPSNRISPGELARMGVGGVIKEMGKRACSLGADSGI